MGTDTQPRRNSGRMPEGPSPTRCEKHDLYHPTKGLCWKCVKGDPAVTPLRDDDEVLPAGAPLPMEEVVPPHPIPYGPLPRGQRHPDNGKEWPKQPGDEGSATADKQTMISAFFRDVITEADMDGPAAWEILSVCMELAVFLMGKNAAYGDSVLDPVRIMSSADPAEQLRVRMDDKLSRLMRGHAAGEDALKDLVGYWVLMRVAEKRRGSNGV